MNKKLSFIGVGNMASAIINGINAEKVCLYDKLPEKAAAFADRGYIAAPTAADAVKYGDYVFLAVKPQNIPDLFAELNDCGVDCGGKVFVSIVAGLAIESIVEGTGCKAVVRTMPNTPMMIGMGVTALSRSEAVSDADFDEVCAIFGTVSETIVLPEEKMNAIISVTSSAPAYVYQFIDAIYSSAKAQGIDDPETLTLICRMVQGSAEMVIRSDKTPSELVQVVKSPGGTTERALNVLDECDLYGMIDRAMKACTARAAELAEMK